MIITGEQAYDDFGISVASAGDVNGDNVEDIIVGAHRGGSYRGRAYIFYGGSLSGNYDASQADVIITGENANDYFGYSIANAVDVNGDNVDDEVVISLRVEDRSRISEWSLKIFDPRGREFITFSGRGRPSERIIWDGRSGKGELVQSAEDYPYVLTVTDILGHTSIEEGQIAVDVLVIREGDRLKILINNITFQPSSPQLILTGDEGQKNKEVLDRLAEIMQKYNSYHIVVEGHAVSLRWADPAAAQREQKDILVPLSRSRAQTVVDELVARRVPANRMQAVGIGGDKPIVPHGNLEERWRNRRVEFYLEK